MDDELIKLIYKHIRRESGKEQIEGILPETVVVPVYERGNQVRNLFLANGAR
jgi:hypothetical protein